LNNEYGLNDAVSDKKGNKILGIVLKLFVALIILALAALLVLYLWQKDNINAVVNASKYTSQELKTQIEDSREEVQTVLDEYDVTQIRDLTPEEELELCKGNMTAEEAVAIIMGSDGDTDGDGDNIQQDGTAYNKSDSARKSSETDPKSAIVQKYVAQLYSLKANYMGQLGTLAQGAKAQYEADKQAYGKTKAVENAVAANLSKAASLESQCDKEVESLLSSLKSELEAIGADTSIVETMRTQYQNEKSLKKSYYLSLKQ
jgi:hypothetical protein